MLPFPYIKNQLFLQTDLYSILCNITYKLDKEYIVLILGHNFSPILCIDDRSTYRVLALPAVEKIPYLAKFPIVFQAGSLAPDFFMKMLGNKV